MLEDYGNVDLDESPCLFPSCGHILTISSMDGHMDVAKYYTADSSGNFTAITALSEPFSMKEVKGCPECRATLREFARYGRIVRRAMVDEATKKFIVWSNQKYVPLAQQLQEQQDLLATNKYDSDNSNDNDNDRAGRGVPSTGFSLTGPPSDQSTLR